MATTKKKSFLDTVAPMPNIIPKPPEVKPVMPIESKLPETKIPEKAPSKYVPEQYNKKTKKMESLLDPKTEMSFRTFMNTDLPPNYGPDVPLISGQELINKLNPQANQAAPNPLAETLNSAFTDTLDVMGDPETQNIARMNQMGQVADDPFLRIGNIPVSPSLHLNKFSGTLIKVINRASYGAGSDLVSIAPESIQNYLRDYSNEDSTDRINERVSDAIASVDLAISMSTDPRNANESAQMFEDAIKSIRAAQAQYKLASQGRLTKKMIDEQTAINNYMEKIAPAKDRMLRINLGLI